MTVPSGAKLEAVLAPGVALWDVAHLLPTHRTKRYAKRPVDAIVRLYAHHSGALGARGFRGMLGSARYAITDPKRDSRGRVVKGTGGGFAGFSYTFWLPFEPDVDPYGRLVIYRGQPDDARSAHTGKDANGHGVAWCFQGNLTTRPPSDAQIEIAEAFLPWAIERYRLELPHGLSWHSESALWGGSGKKACPGPHVTEYVRAYRSRVVYA